MTDSGAVHRVRVRYCETDQMGVAHHGAYVAWLEEARTEWLRARGRSYRDWEASGLLLQVVDLHVRYRRPTRYDDVVEIRTRVVERKRASLCLSYELFVEGGALVAEATTTLASVDAHGTLRRLPAEL